MQLLAFTIFDNKALQYHPPFFASTDGSAVRSLRDLVEDVNSTIGRHPSDYVLYCCGAYDDQNGHFAAEMPLRHIMDAVALVKIQPAFNFQERQDIANTTLTPEERKNLRSV